MVTDRFYQHGDGGDDGAGPALLVINGGDCGGKVPPKVGPLFHQRLSW